MSAHVYDFSACLRLIVLSIHRYTPVTVGNKPQAPVYHIVPLTTAITDYAIGPRKLSANEQFFVGAQMELGLYQAFLL